jgi:hypothetical protein
LADYCLTSREHETLPTLKTLQEAVIGRNEEDMEDYIVLVSHLTRYAVMDPGVPNPKEVKFYVM